LIGNYYFYWAIAVVVITIIIAYSLVLIFAAELGNHPSASAAATNQNIIRLLQYV
jgi:uncharacterized membrane protein